MSDSDLQGVVSSFDPAAGLGIVESADAIAYPFHCIEIADGTRSIAVGAVVTFQVIPKLGRYEASQLVT